MAKEFLFLNLTEVHFSKRAVRVCIVCMCLYLLTHVETLYLESIPLASSELIPACSFLWFYLFIYLFILK